MSSAPADSLNSFDLFTNLGRKNFSTTNCSEESVRQAALLVDSFQPDSFWQQQENVGSAVSESDLDDQIIALEQLYQAQTIFLAGKAETVAALRYDTEENQKAIEECRANNADMEREICRIRQQLLNIEKGQDLNKCERLTSHFNEEEMRQSS
ncbi:uncharacterized protein [Watersipora subatra]|uniref:uncharacterized protein n=1 Tax=Watersipora subatra TaxID=2589382 RepID=UPI00355B16A0